MADSSRRSGAHSIRIVLAFTMRHWARHPWLAVATGVTMSLGTLTEVFAPYPTLPHQGGGSIVEG